ncbi:hypothetical protein HanLR1_Chr02g0065571 [Helianthus annuus]|nr:hypothetical protein HanLR1_Chr02g0065571 [Helianthus annuus]
MLQNSLPSPYEEEVNLVYPVDKIACVTSTLLIDLIWLKTSSGITSKTTLQATTVCFHRKSKLSEVLGTKNKRHHCLCKTSDTTTYWAYDFTGLNDANTLKLLDLMI